MVGSLPAQSSASADEQWRIVIKRKDGMQVPFVLQRMHDAGKTALLVINGLETIRVTEVTVRKDSMFFAMPSFESSFRVKVLDNGDLRGTYVKGTAGATQYWEVYGARKEPQRFNSTSGDAAYDISGKWKVTFTRANGTKRNAVAVFEQHGNKLYSTFLTPAADYRYLEGVISGDTLQLSAFDGDNIHLFGAKITDAQKITDGIFYNGFTGKEAWVATKSDSVRLPESGDATQLRPGMSKLDFTFDDVNGNRVSINDNKYKNKVVIIQLMGSWCANCLDETRFLAQYYRANRKRGIEIIGLSYELTTDVARSKKSLAKFQKLLTVQYPLLITGVAAGDDLKAEKTLPQLTRISSFPTTIFIDKKGNVREIHPNFYGPATGQFYLQSKDRFYQTVDRLLME